MTTEHAERRDLPGVMVNRLPVYTRVLRERVGDDAATMSSERLAKRTGVSLARLRKRLSAWGSDGVRRLGYKIERLGLPIASALGLERSRPVVCDSVQSEQVGARLIDAAAHSTVNFSPTVLTVPNGVQARGVDMASELQILAFREQDARMDAEIGEMKELMA